MMLYYLQFHFTFERVNGEFLVKGDVTDLLGVFPLRGVGGACVVFGEDIFVSGFLATSGVLLFKGDFDAVCS